MSAGPNPTGDADRTGSQRRSGVARGRPVQNRTAGKRAADGEPVTARGGRLQHSRRDENRGQGSGRLAAQRRGDAPQDGEPARLELPADADGSELDRDVRQELLTLSKGLSELVARHLVMVARLLDEDPQLALAHARFARSKAGRVAAVREVAGLCAYHAGEWSEALAELRAARRLGADTGRLAVLADCERALGRPEHALEIAQSPEAQQLGTEESVELRIVAAGARRDLGQFDAAVLALQGPDLETPGEEPWRARLRYAYADNLLAAGREQDAIRWFLAAAEVDVEEATDAAERAVELSERPAPQ